jgi:hypothetical protein
METATIEAATAISERNIAERRLTALVNAVRTHEQAQRTKPYARRAEDLGLYRRVRQIIGEQEA